MKRANRETPSWPALALAAAAGAAAGIFVFGNFISEGKKLRRLVTAPYAIGDEAFVRSISHLLGPPLLEGNRVTHLCNGSQTFPAMLAAIEAAERTICFENFIFWTGRVAGQFAEALAARARAGVRVHMLQDAIGCDCRDGAEVRLLRSAGVELEIFRFTHLTRINERTHRKIMVIDGKHGFIGGTGIGDVWDGRGNQPDQWRDSHFHLEGPAVAQMQQAFLDNWMMSRGAVLHGDDYFPKIDPAGGQMCQVFKSAEDEGSDSTRLVYLLSIAAARKSIRIANAYFIPDPLFLSALIEARSRGVAVEIIVPGPLINQPLVRSVSRSLWEPLLASGIRIFEFQPTNFHCKYFIADDCWCSVGSTNLDGRSLIFNEECNLNVLDGDFAREMSGVFESDKRQSFEITLEELRRRPLSQRVVGVLGRLVRNQL